MSLLRIRKALDKVEQAISLLQASSYGAGPAISANDPILGQLKSAQGGLVKLLTDGDDPDDDTGAPDTMPSYNMPLAGTHEHETYQPW